MQTIQNTQVAVTPIGWTFDTGRSKAKLLWSAIVEVLAVCANAWAAANIYEELSMLSNAELKRRGIPRAELHRFVFSAMAAQRSAAIATALHDLDVSMPMKASL